MQVFILTWNPTRWSWEDHGYQDQIAETAEGRMAKRTWSIGGRKTGIDPGDRGLLLRGHDQRGLVASGFFTSGIYDSTHFDGSGVPQGAADLDWDAILPPDEGLPVEVLRREVPEVPWDHLQGSGVLVSDPAAERLLNLWDDHLIKIGRTPATAMAWRSPEEERTYVEGDVTKVLVNRYERDQHVRDACIDHWGTRCCVCDFDFGEVYGDRGQGFIHVHHLHPLADHGQAHQVDPIKDLRPVCPNCHAMLHRGGLLSIEALRAHLPV